MSTVPTTSHVAHPSPPTLEGWYTLHERWHLDAGLWWHLEAADRERHATALAAWLEQARTPAAGGDAGCWLTVGQKADLLVMLYRHDALALLDAQASFRRQPFFGFLKPAGSHVAIVEAGLYEAVAIAEQRVRAQGIDPGSREFTEAIERETAVHRELLRERVMKPIPLRSHLCSYPMNKRRGEQWNWYALTLDERRALMRGHGRMGHRYHGQVDQVVQGSIGLDDWEWMVDLHADDPLLFKKLVTDMRFDPASSRYAEFGDFIIGVRADAERLRAFLLGEDVAR